MQLRTASPWQVFYAADLMHEPNEARTYGACGERSPKLLIRKVDKLVLVVLPRCAEASIATGAATSRLGPDSGTHSSRESWAAPSSVTSQQHREIGMGATW